MGEAAAEPAVLLDEVDEGAARTMAQEMQREQRAAEAGADHRHRGLGGAARVIGQVSSAIGRPVSKRKCRRVDDHRTLLVFGIAGLWLTTQDGGAVSVWAPTDTR